MKTDLLNEVSEHTPCYVFDSDSLYERVNGIKKILGDAGCCFAVKANPFLTGILGELCDRLEVCSPGEYEICRESNAGADKLIISGVNKSHESMERIITSTCGKSIYTLESKRHYDIISDICRENDIHVRVLVRLSSGNQFGMSKTAFEEILPDLQRDDYVELCGIHFYSGTQKKVSRMEKELRELDEYALHIRERFGITNLELEYGPGLSYDYFGEKPKDEYEDLRTLRAFLDNIHNFKSITVEMGRYISSCCGYYVTRVADVKENDGRSYCIVDGGIHQLNYYGQLMGMKLPHFEAAGRKAGAGDRKWTVCGSLCTAGDVIMKEAPLGDMEIGDVLIFKDCGAYSVTEGMSLFLSRNLPEIYIYSEDNGFQKIRDAVETYKLNEI